MQFINQPESHLQRHAGTLSICKWLSVLAVALVPQVVASETISIFAASSLRDALGDVAAGYEELSGDEVVLVFASTSTVARQVTQGAPADVVLLADQAWADWLVEQGAVEQTRAFAGNHLVLIGRGEALIADPAEIAPLLGDGRLAMAQVDAVPAGRYGKAALQSLGLWDALSPQVVQADNVRAALRFVERGEAELGIGYASDLVALPTLSQVYAFAPDSHPAIVYSGAEITPRGADFMDYLLTDDAQDILSDWGFAPLDITQ